MTELFVTTCVVYPVSGMLAVPETNGMAWSVCGPVLTMQMALFPTVHRMPIKLWIFSVTVTWCAAL